MWISQPASSLDEKQYTLQVFNGNWMENGIEMENGNEKLDNAFATMPKKTWHAIVDVLWQESGWVDTICSVEWSNKTLKS